MAGRDDTEPISILVIDDHTLVRQAMCETLRLEPGFRVVAEASDAASGVLAAGRTKPDVVLLDIGMPAHQPAHTVRRLREVSPRSRTIVVSMYAEPRLVQELLDIGVRGFLHKSVSTGNSRRRSAECTGIRGGWWFPLRGNTIATVRPTRRRRCPPGNGKWWRWWPRH